MVDQKNGHVHERVRLDKVEVGVVDVCLAVVGAGGQYQPVLLLELVGTDLPMEFGDVEKGAVQCTEYTCLPYVPWNVKETLWVYSKTYT